MYFGVIATTSHYRQLYVFLVWIRELAGDLTIYLPLLEAPNTITSEYVATRV